LFIPTPDVRGFALKLADIETISVAIYIDQIDTKVSKPTVKRHRTAIRQQ
jgi:hypothetical protein